MSFWRKDKSLPAVKKVSELIKTKSHNQKKYISLMLVPSYSTGKTRSLRIPRIVLYCLAICMFVVFSVIMGFYLRSMHFQRQANQLSRSLDETQATFNAFQYETEMAQSQLIDATTQMIEDLSEEQMRAQREISIQERRHQETLEDIWDIINVLEEQIREFDEKQQDIISNLGARSGIPPIAELLNQMEETHDGIRSALEINLPEAKEIPETPSVGLLGFSPLEPLTEIELLQRLIVLSTELEIQRQILISLESYKEKMQPYLYSFPTLWPLRGRISSGFGWRANPFGGRNREHHNGIDIPARTGTAIRAAGDGVVTFQGWQSGYGNTVTIDHGNGITSMYAHNSRNIVREGQRVNRGDIIAHVGSTGRSTGAHLHFEVRHNGTAINPVPFLVEHHR